MDSLPTLDRPKSAVDMAVERADADRERGGLVPLAEIMARLLERIDARRVR